MNKPKIIAVIPARGGSKRIPYKNIIDFMGKPMIAWTIQAAQDANVFDRIVVSTDNQKIINTAKKFNNDTPFLRDKYNDDITPVSAATIHCVSQAENYWHESYDIVVQLMANTPIRGTSDILAALDNFKNRHNDFQLSCFKFGWMNPWWAAKLKKDNQPDFIFPGGVFTRSQDLEDLYCPTGAIWIAKVDQLKKAGSFYGPKHKFFPIPWESAVDIDDYDDLKFAKAVFLMKQNEK